MTHRTFGQKLAAGFALVVFLALTIAAVGFVALRTVVASKDHVLDSNASNLIDARILAGQFTAKSAAGRAYLLTGDLRFSEQMRTEYASFQDTVARLRKHLEGEAAKRALDGVELAAREHQAVAEQVFAARQAGAAVDVVAQQFETKMHPMRKAIDQHLAALVREEENALRQGRDAATELADRAAMLLLGLSVLALAAAIAVAVTLTRALGSQIGSAVQQVRSSSTELQAAANQQASSVREQATAMSEIATTINELLVTSRQIAESARQVSVIAGETGTAADVGDESVRRSQEAVASIRRQVDQIVTHMVDLGRKSQQVGAILDLINELADQTNVLSINASIEAAGAGDAGRRFGVVADEIRKLADRVAGSTRDIRTLLEEIRSAVNTTVMATESGSKAVDAGVRQFSEVASSFQRIASQVQTTTDAAREIELSTKQQATAVEQVNVAISSVAQASRESESGSQQTVQTATQLSELSRSLALVVEASAA